MSESTLPDYWLSPPPMDLDEAMQRACDALWTEAVTQGLAQPISYTLPIPKWQFLSFVAEKHGLALHGSGETEIARFEPRQSQDLAEFGAQKAVYAAADGIWPIYFAIVNRAQSPTLHNACVFVEQADGTEIGPYYYFSISKQAMAHEPYRNGMIYLLPRATFTGEPVVEVGAWRIRTTQLASLEAVAPLAKLAVVPEDFPFLAQMWTHDDARLEEYANAMRQGLPMPE